jgi:hypothetical protein
MQGKQLFIKVQMARLAERSNGELRILGGAQLPRQQHVQGQMQGQADLPAHHHTAARDGQDQAVRPVGIVPQGRCQPLPCLNPIAKPNGSRGNPKASLTRKVF